MFIRRELAEERYRMFISVYILCYCLGEFLYGHYFVMPCFVSFLVLESSRSWLLYFYCLLDVPWLLELCALPEGGEGWFAVCDCGISWSYSWFYGQGSVRGSRKFFQRGPTFTTFLVDVGREDPNTTISGPLSFKWRFAGGPIVAQHWMLAW